jgi:hypothetical protein
LQQKITETFDHDNLLTACRSVMMPEPKQQRREPMRETEMAHVVVLRVNLVGDREEGMKGLDEMVIPHVKSLAGYQRGMWLHTADAKLGTAVITFDTEANANAAVDAVKPPPGGPTVIDCTVFEIAREA